MAPRKQRSKVYVCYWCREVPIRGSQYRTPLEDYRPRGSVGRVVCSPACPDRPEGVLCYRRGEEVWA